MDNQAAKLQQEAIVIDGTCPLASVGNHFEKWIAGGATAIAATVNRPPELMRDTMARLGEWLKKLRQNPEKLLLIQTVEDIFRAKKGNKRDIIFHLQGTTPFETDLNSIEMYHRLGVRMVHGPRRGTIQKESRCLMSCITY